MIISDLFLVSWYLLHLKMVFFTSQKLFLIIFIPTIVSSAHAFRCMNENEEPVDWFVAYKLPKLRHSQELIAQGLAYAYMTSEDFSGWKLSKFSVNSSDCMMAKTLQPLLTTDDLIDKGFLVYNDQPPNEASKSNKGHNKGVVLLNNTGGFWLIHSVPHFPPTGLDYEFPETGVHFGQSFLCISLDLQNLNEVGIQLQYNEPEIYLQNIGSDLQSKVPQLLKAASNITVKSAPWYRQTVLTSRKGTQFLSFAKSKEFDKDLYEDWLAPALRTDLLVETWPNGAGKLPSDCTKPFKVFNVKSVMVKAANITFSNTHDHSKWAVSKVSNGSNWICIGDINRMEHQKWRGGGTVCLKNKFLANDYQKLVQDIEQCQPTITKDKIYSFDNLQ